MELLSYKQFIFETDNLRSSILRHAEEIAALKIKPSQQKIARQVISNAKKSSKLSDRQLLKLLKKMME